MIAPRMILPLVMVVFAILAPQKNGSLAFAPERSVLPRLVEPTHHAARFPVALYSSAQEESSSKSLEEGLSPQESKVYGLLRELSESKLAFRIIVVGNGAILESTNVLGPTFKLGSSPKTGESIVTFASEDQSFEFHVKPAQIASAALVEKPSKQEGRTMRLMRFSNAEKASVCTLILADDNESTASWFATMKTNYGSEVTF